MKFAYIMSPGRGDTDRVLERLADALLSRGVRVCGVVQVNSETCEGGLCDMDVRVLPDGPVIRISQSLGREARGCRLDPSALEHAVAEVVSRMGGGADLLILNKFGKHEADGRGFRDVIGEALARDIPTITGLNALNEKAFVDFSGGLATRVAADVDTLLAWVDEALGEHAPARENA